MVLIIYLSARLTAGAKQNVERLKAGRERQKKRGTQSAKEPNITSGKHVDRSLEQLLICKSAAGKEPAKRLVVRG